MQTETQLSFEILTPLNFAVQFFSRVMGAKMDILEGSVHKNVENNVHSCTILRKMASKRCVYWEKNPTTMQINFHNNFFFKNSKACVETAELNLRMKKKRN